MKQFLVLNEKNNKLMKKIKLTSLVVICFAVWLLLPIPIGAAGKYNPISNIIWCSTPYVCLHEIGHKLDDLSGWPSKDPEFQKTVEDLHLDWWDNPQENYAQIYAAFVYDNDLLFAELQHFYDWELSDQLLERHKLWLTPPQ